MATNLTDIIKKVRTALRGEDVRGSIADGLEYCGQISENAKADMEATAAATKEAIESNAAATKEQLSKDIDAKAAAALKSIPESYTELDGSVKQLKEDLYGDDYFSSLKNTFFSIDGTRNSSSNWNGILIDVSEVNIIGNVVVNGVLTSYGENVKSYAFLDENKSVIESSDLRLISPTLKIPKNAKHIILNSYGGGFSVRHIVLAEESLKNKTNKDGLTKIPCIMEKRLLDKKIVKPDTDNAYFVNNKYMYVSVYKIEKGKKYFISAAIDTGSTNCSIIIGNDILENAFIPIYYNRYTAANNTTADNYFYSDFDGYAYINGWNDDFEKNSNLYELVNFSSIYKSEHAFGNHHDSHFYFYECSIKADDILLVDYSSTSDSANHAIFVSDKLRNKADIEADGIELTNGKAVYKAKRDWNGFTVWADGNYSDTYEYEIEIIHSQIRKNEKNKTLYIAANNSSNDDKYNADFICDGVNDEEEINRAINLVKSSVGVVVLYDGDYYIDSFSDYPVAGKTEKAAIFIKKDGSTDGGVSICGRSSGKPQKAVIHVNESAFDEISDDITPCVVSGGADALKYVGGWGFNIRHVEIKLPNKKHKCIAINYQHCYWGIVDSCNLTVDGFGQDVVPVENLIGLRGWAGWSDGSIIGAYDTYACGFRVGFQLGGEHVICERLGTRYCYTAYTFGEYDLDENSGAQVHPITLINCCDEHSATLPKFYKSGNANSRGAGRCLVNLIDFNIEYYPLITNTPVVGAMEEFEGGWVGNVVYSPEDDEKSNKVYIPFWADGHGKNFKSVNTSQPQMGTSALRKTFAPNYMQQYFDTDLNKVVYCKEPSTKTWIDANGNIID